jgi:hypothetical protein
MAQEAQAKKKAEKAKPPLLRESILANVLKNNPKLTREEAIEYLKEAGGW